MPAAELMGLVAQGASEPMTQTTSPRKMPAADGVLLEISSPTVRGRAFGAPSSGIVSTPCSD
jgi:hypothetical protein